MDNLEFILVVNSPGELGALAKPIIEKIKSHSTKTLPLRITLILSPCQFSSGREVQYAKTLGVDNIISADEYRKWILGIPLKRKINFKYRGVVLYLGGDLMHAVLVAKKLNYKVYSYIHGQKTGWKNVFNKFFVLDKKIESKLLKDGVKNENVKVIGDLMLNSITPVPKDEARKKWQLSPKKPVVAFLPGSREWEIDFMLPFYEQVGYELKKMIPGIQLMLIVSPFLSFEDIERRIDDGLFDVMAPLNSITAADLAVAIPGTNNAQVAAIGTPLLMIFPLNKIDNIPVEGILHYITKIPILGKIIKRAAAETISKKTKFFSLPNIKANRMIAPEMKGRLKVDKVVGKILELLNQPQKLKQIGQDLKEVMGESNAAELIVREILDENIIKTN